MIRAKNRNEVMRCSMTDTKELERLLNLCFGYERPEIAEFRRAVVQFEDDLPAMLDALRERIDAAYTTNVAFKQTADRQCPGWWCRRPRAEPPA